MWQCGSEYLNAMYGQHCYMVVRHGVFLVMMKNLEAFETWLYKKMLRISGKNRVTNDEIYRRMGTSKSLLRDIVRRQLSFFGHVLRKDKLEKLVVTGFGDGKRARDRQ